MPTLTLDSTTLTGDQLLDGYTLNLTRDGVCTGHSDADCVITSNFTGGTIINPVRSARLSTKDKKTITYGRVEVVAKMPAGDWLWPAIWYVIDVGPLPSLPFCRFSHLSLNKLPLVYLHSIFSCRMLPQDSIYGEWPKSGEIDVIELRGNSPETYGNGRDTAGSALHWGLTFNTDRFLQTSSKHYLRRSDYSQGFHTFGMEWSEKYLFTYIDNRLLQILSVGFGGGNMWTRSGLSDQGYS